MNKTLDYETHREHQLSDDTQRRLFAAGMAATGNELDPLPGIGQKLCVLAALVVVFFAIGALAW